ncbi:MAG: TonB-dependent receptor plug domain-containing protein, partial [Pedobacter sp.]|nr:TonB-dependent receptor plug domain-containing protein [Pedobacter sp.]
VYQLCLLLYKEGLLYENSHDVKHKGLMRESLAIYNQNGKVINGFSSFKSVLNKLEKSITQTKLKLNMDNKALPGQPMLLRISYKNLQTVYYRIIPKKAVDKVLTGNQLSKLPLFQIKPIVSDSIVLPDSQDYNSHTAYGKVNALPIGDYCLLFSTERDGASDNDKTDYLSLVVSNLTLIHTDKTVFVLDRKIGKSVVGAEVQGLKKSYTNSVPSAWTSKLIERHFTGNEGYALISNDTVNALKVIFKGDTIEEDFSVQKDSRPTQPEELFNKDKYEDLVEYHDEQARVHIFTDRSIYRPGQTVHYKAIVLTRNPKTGGIMLFNKKQLKYGLFNNVYKKWLSENEPMLLVSDPVNRKVDSVKLTMDNYGSFAGSFVIPKSASTGEWTIEPDYLDVDDRNDGSFKVEEYKRPTFEITVEKPKKMLFPGDEFLLKFKVKSFTGAVLSGLPIDCQITRTSETIYIRGVGYPNAKSNINVGGFVIDSTLMTDDKGEATITVKETSLTWLRLADKAKGNFSYDIDLDVKDATGESAELSETFSVSSQPIKITIQTPNTIDRAFITPMNVSTVADNEGVVGKTVKVKVYRFLSKKKVDLYRYGYVQPFSADEWIYSKADLQKWFPFQDFDNTPAIDKKELAYETSVNTATFEKLLLDQSKLTAGEYELEASVEENGKVIGTSTKTIEIFDSKNRSVPANPINFSYVKSTAVKLGESVKIYTGSTVAGFSIYHLYYATKNKTGLTYKQQYFFKNDDSGLNEFDFKVPADVYEQLLLTKISVRENEVIKMEKRFFIPVAEKVNPEITVESYRKVLAPGAAATFTVSVKTKNQHTAVQLMSTMYDASLDKLEKHQWNVPEIINGGFTDFYANWPNTIKSKVEGAIRTFSEGFSSYNGAYDVSQALEGRVAGVSITQSESSLNEVLVVGYGSMRRTELTGAISTIRIRGLSSLADYKQPLIILDGVVYTGELSSISPTAISEMMVLKSADASALYGARAADGVLVISTKG